MRYLFLIILLLAQSVFAENISTLVGVQRSFGFAVRSESDVNRTINNVSFTTGDCAASACCKVSIDQASGVDCDNQPVAVTNGQYSMTASADELSGCEAVYTFKDAASTKRFADKVVTLRTYGSGSACHGIPGVDVKQWNSVNVVTPDTPGSPKVTLTSGTGTGQIALSSGAVTVGTNNDKSNYSLAQAFPSNFASLAITGGGAVTVGTNADKTGYSLSAGSISSGTFASGAITSTVLAANAIGATQIASNAITDTKIASGAITNAKIASGAISAATLASSTITADKIATSAITTDKIQDGAIGVNKIGTGAIGSSQIADGAITSGKFSSGAITGSVMAADSIGAAQISDAATGKIWSNATRSLTDKAGFSIAGTKTTLDALNDVSASTVNTQVTSALNSYDPPTKTEMDAAFTEIKGTGWSAVTNTLKAISDAVGGIEGGGGGGGDCANVSEIAAAVWNASMGDHLLAGSTGQYLNRAATTTLQCQAQVQN